MMRSYLLQETRPAYLHTVEEVLFPEVSKQTTHESINSRDMLQSQPFIFIEQDSMEFRCELQQLQEYEEDKLKFVTRVKVDESRCSSDRNRIMLVKEPVYSNSDTITFLLILEWFPNYVRAKQSRKGSFASEKQLSVRSGKQRARLDIEEMLSAVFLLSEKIYIEERYIDEFMGVIADRHEIHHRQLNCLTIFQQQLIDKHNANMQSTQAETRYFYYQNEGSSNYNYVLASDMDRSSVRSHTENIKPLTLHRNSSSRALEKSPKSSMSKSLLVNEQGQKQCNFNVKRVKKYFSTVEYLISDGELRLEVIVYHLNDNRNVITAGFRLEAIKELFKEWGRWGSYAQLYALNRDKVLSSALAQCIDNYRAMVSIELSELDLTTLDNIYTIIKEFNAKMTAQFLEETQEFVVEPDYGEWIKKLDKELSILEQELLNSYSLVKEQYGERIMRNLLKKSNRSSGENYALTKIVGKEEISTLDIGFRIYKKIVEDTLPAVFEDLISKDIRHTYTWRGKGHSDENELNNIETRIDLCQDRKKGLDREIELIQKQAYILEEVLRGVQENWQQGESVSEHRTLRLVSL